MLTEVALRALIRIRTLVVQKSWKIPKPKKIERELTMFDRL